MEINNQVEFRWHMDLSFSAIISLVSFWEHAASVSLHYKRIDGVWPPHLMDGDIISQMSLVHIALAEWGVCSFGSLGQKQNNIMWV